MQAGQHRTAAVIIICLPQQVLISRPNGGAGLRDFLLLIREQLLKINFCSAAGKPRKNLGHAWLRGCRPM
jgi:hypothetical protein